MLGVEEGVIVEQQVNVDDAGTLREGLGTFHAFFNAFGDFEALRRLIEGDDFHTAIIKIRL